MVLVLQGDSVILIDGQAPRPILEHLSVRDNVPRDEVLRILLHLVGPVQVEHRGHPYNLDPAFLEAAEGGWRVR